MSDIKIISLIFLFTFPIASSKQLGKTNIFEHPEHEFLFFFYSPVNHSCNEKVQNNKANLKDLHNFK